MNPVRFLALVYHYAYFWMVEEQSYKLKDGKPIPKWPRDKALYAYVFVWAWVIGLAFMDYAIIEAWRGFPYHKSQMVELPKTDIRSWLAVAPVLFAIVYANSLLLNKNSVENYRVIFHSWPKKKRMRWKIYTLIVSVIPFGLLLIVGSIHQSLLQP
jgi:hypothetical protein